MEMSHNRLFSKHTGRLLVKIKGLGEAEVFGGNWPVIKFILFAYKKLKGEDRLGAEERLEAQNWELLRSFFHGDDGVIEVKQKEVA